MVTWPLTVLADGMPFLALLPSAFFPVVIIILIALVGLIIWMIWSRPLRSSQPDMTTAVLSGEISLMSRPLLSKGEATLLNLIRLAVQDNYLVFAKLPVSSLVKVPEVDKEMRRSILKAIQSVRIDVVLVHPGTLCSSKGIKFVQEEESPNHQNERERFAEAVLQEAGIEIIQLELHTTYTVAKLVDQLGLGEAE